VKVGGKGKIFEEKKRIVSRIWIDFYARTDENDALGFRVINKKLDAVKVIGPVEGIAANSDNSRLPETDLHMTFPIL
jgi:hypothetical protein